MAPITCKVVDALHMGVQGVHVILDCRDQFHNCVARLDSKTDDKGEISFWFPFPSPGDADILEPQIVDTTDIPRMSLTFFPNIRFTPPAPWMSIRADLYLTGLACHGVILHLEANPRLEYTTHPVAGPIGELSMASRARDLLMQTPSPLRLPSPLSTPPGGDCTQTKSVKRNTEKNAKEVVTRSRKRKLDLDGEDDGRGSRRRIE